MKYTNPIISGMNPDPSICRAGNDFYLVTSSFEYYPVIPIYKSQNLVNWEQIGYCLTRDSQLKLNGCKASGGIYAPTIRYEKGIFFVTATNVSDRGNFIVHTENPQGEWSDPVFVDQEGIDPSIFLDEGKTYFLSTGTENGKNCICMCEINPFTGEKYTNTRVISYGCGGRFPEAPHIYRIWNKYYLLLAEGGTEYAHSVTIQRSEHPYGPYEEALGNPILTNRNDSDNDIQCTGHGDLVEDVSGRWWMVCLGVRVPKYKDEQIMLHHLGRETFLAPVCWKKDGWPSAGIDGRIYKEMEGDLPGPAPAARTDSFYADFHAPKLQMEFNYLRNPVFKNYQPDAGRGELTLHGTERTINEAASPTWIGIRQKAFQIVLNAKMRAETGADGMKAGVTAYYNHEYHYDLFLTRQAGQYKVQLAKHVHDIYMTAASIDVEEGGEIEFQIRADRKKYTFLFNTGISEQFIELGWGLTAGLSTAGTHSMSFTGVYLALFAENCTVSFSEFSMTRF